MLKTHLTEIKGRLLEHFFEVHHDMNTSPEGVDYEVLYLGLAEVMIFILKMSTVDDLDRFCDEYGLNEIDPEFSLSFPNLAKKYLGFNEE